MLKKARLLVVFSLLIATLTACAAPKGTSQPTMVNQPLSIASASASATSTPTPTASAITVKRASDLYLDAVCESNATAFQVSRALSAYPIDISAVHNAAAAASAAAKKAATTLSDQTALWPSTTEQDRYTVAGDEQELAKYYDLVQYSTEDSINSLSVPSGSSTAPQSIRDALAIKGDHVITCVGHNYTAAFPAGYPKVVKVSSLPAQPRSSIAFTGAKKAVAMAPGVWAALSPGAEVGDVVSGNSADGFCASIKAYERKYLFGNSLGGSCW